LTEVITTRPEQKELKKEETEKNENIELTEIEIQSNKVISYEKKPKKRKKKLPFWKNKKELLN